MQILIAYTSKTGTTATCAAMLKDALASSHGVTLCDAGKETIPAPSGFDAVILGSSVRMERVSKPIRQYIARHTDALNAMPCAVFLCCGFPDRFDDYVHDGIPRTLIPSLGFHCFGGELDPKKAHGIDRLLLRSIRNSIREHDFEDGFYEGSLPNILPEAITRLADRLCGR